MIRRRPVSCEDIATHIQMVLRTLKTTVCEKKPRFRLCHMVAVRSDRTGPGTNLVTPSARRASGIFGDVLCEAITPTSPSPRCRFQRSLSFFVTLGGPAVRQSIKTQPTLLTERISSFSIDTQLGDDCFVRLN